MKYITLEKDYTIKLNSKITKHMTPKFVYLPLQNNIEKIKREIKKEEKLAQNLLSPVSGQIVGTKNCLTVNGKIENCLVILNDYKETLEKRSASTKDLDKIPFKKIKEELKKQNYEDLAIKLQKIEEGATLMVNGIEDEPYVATEIFINKEYTREILATLDAIGCHKQEHPIEIVLKNNDRETIDAYENLLGTYSKTKLTLVPDYYLIGKPNFLKEYLNRQEKMVLFLPSEIKTIYQIVKRHRFQTEIIFTISGDAIENPQIIEAKIGSSVSEIIKTHIKKKKVETVYYINGIMTGKTMPIENLIVTKELKSILIMKKENIPEKECINCGKCVTFCPKNCNPKMVYETKEAKYAKNCIDCGLCSYICPSYINLRKYLKGELHE